MKNIIKKIQSFIKSPILADIFLFYLPCAFLIAGGLFHTLHDILKYADLVACILLVASCIRSFIKDKNTRPLIVTMFAWAILCDLFIHSITLFEIALICCASIGKDMRKIIKVDATIRILCAIIMIVMLQMNAIGATAPAITEWQHTLGFYNPAIAATQFFIIFLELLYADSWQPGINTVIYGGMSIYVSLFLANSGVSIAMAIATIIIALIVGAFQLKPLKKTKESAVAFVNKHELCYKSGYALRLYYPFVCATIALGREALLLLIVLAIPVVKAIFTLISKKREQKVILDDDIDDPSDESLTPEADDTIKMPAIAQGDNVEAFDDDEPDAIAVEDPNEDDEESIPVVAPVATPAVEKIVEASQPQPSLATKVATDDFTINPPIIPKLEPEDKDFIDATMPPLGFDENLIKVDLPPFDDLSEEDYM